MSSFFGERIDDNTTPRSYRMPGAGTPWVQDGRPVDAGTAHHFDNNLSHYCSEMALRPLIFEPGPGGIKVQNLQGYSGLTDTTIRAITSGWAQSTADWISWDRRTARVWGPFNGIADVARTNLSGNALRKVTWYVDVNGGGANTLTLYLAITSTNQPPSAADIGDGSGGFFFVDNSVPSGRGTRVVQLTPTYVLPRRNLRSRPSATSTIMTSTMPFFLWLGWYSTNISDAIIGISAWEDR
jgi:hypothetical protein